MNVLPPRAVCHSHTAVSDRKVLQKWPSNVPSPTSTSHRKWLQNPISFTTPSRHTVSELHIPASQHDPRIASVKTPSKTPQIPRNQNGTSLPEKIEFRQTPFQPKDVFTSPTAVIRQGHSYLFLPIPGECKVLLPRGIDTQSVVSKNLHLCPRLYPHLLITTPVETS